MGEQTLWYGDLNLFSVFLWHITLVYLIVLLLLSFVIYRNTKDKLFLYYFYYIFLLFTYIVCRNYYFMKMQLYRPVFLYSYYVQVLYLCVYFHFGLSIINFKSYFPHFTKWIYRYLGAVVSIGTVIFLAGLFQWTPAHYMADYYHKYFFPAHISLALVIIYRAIKLRQERLRIYFLIGTISYLVLGTAAVLANFYQPAGLAVRPVAYFYLGVIIECTFFAIGLGVRVSQLYADKLETERRLNTTQRELREQMQKQIEEQERDKLILQGEKEVQILATQVALLENKVLRSQMNAHFIFNVLNSIKAYIIERDVEKAVTYLNKFAKLIRLVLDASRDERYTLADEIKAIHWYVDIEKIRVNEAFSVEFDISLQEDPATVVFPPLLMQPFVENAIWHGLSHSRADKKLTILIYNEAPAIVIEILDNGIGYSQGLREKENVRTHRSHGVDITTERIGQFNKKHTSRITFGIEDRQDQAGTRVWIKVLNIQ